MSARNQYLTSNNMSLKIMVKKSNLHFAVEAWISNLTQGFLSFIKFLSWVLGWRGYAYPFFVMFAHKKKQQQQYQRSSDQA